MKKHLITIILLAWTLSSHAQQRFIYGKITEFRSSDVVKDVKLTVIDSDTSLKPGTEKIVTFEKKNNPKSGYFELLIDDRFDSLKLECQGYESKTLDITQVGGPMPDSLLKMKRVINLLLSISGPSKTEDVIISTEHEHPDMHFVSYKYGRKKSFRLNEDYKLVTISYEGFKDTTVMLAPMFAKPSDQREFLCEIDLIPMQQAFFGNSLSTAGKRDQKFGEIPASVTVITQEEIQAQGYQDITEILESVTGMYLFKDHSWAGGDPIIGVRGFFSQGFNNNVIVLVNGINQYEDYWGFFPFASFGVPVESIDRIEIIKGPMSVLYGSGAFFGVINIITNEKKNTDEELSAFGSASYGNLNSYNIASGFDISKDRIKVSFGGTISRTDGMDQPLARSLPDSMASVVEGQTTAGLLSRENRYFNLSAGFQNETKTLQINLDVVSAYQARNVFESFVFSGNDCNCPLPSNNEQATGSINRTTSNYGGIDLIFTPKNISYNLTAYYRNYNTLIDYTAGGNRIGLSGFSSEAIEVELSASGEVGKFSGIAGTNIRRSDDLFTFFDLPNDSLSDGNSYIKLQDNGNLSLFSIFSEVNYKISERLSITAGLRAEALADFTYDASFNPATNIALPPSEVSIANLDPVLIPRAALVYGFDFKSHSGNNVDESKRAYHNYLKFLYGQATKRPSFGNYTDNAGLNFPRIQTIELNYLANLLSSDSLRLVLNASVYYNHGEDLISRLSSVSEDGTPIFSSENVREMDTNGAEIALDFMTGNRRKGIWNLHISGSYNRSTETQTLLDNVDTISTIQVTGEAPSYSPELLAYFKSSYTRRLGHVLLTAGFNIRYISSVLTPFQVKDADIREDFFRYSLPFRIGDRVPSYFVSGANLRLEKTNPNGIKSWKRLDGLYLNLHVSNLLDAQVQYPTTGNQSTWAVKGLPGYGRRYNLTIGINF